MSKKQLFVIFSLLMLSSTLCLGQSKVDPPYWFDDDDDVATVYFLSSNDVTEGGYLAIYGDDFRSSGRVTLNGTDAPIELWTYRKIVIRVPEGSSGPLQVIPEGGTASSAHPLSVHGGNVYHLDASAPAGGNGSAGSPWNRFEAANDGVQPGDFVVVHGGTYYGSGGDYAWFMDTGGNSGNSITYFGMVGETAIVSGSQVPKSSIRVEAPYVNVVGLVASTSKTINLYLHGAYSQAVDCEIKDGDGSVSTKGQGMNMWATGTKALGNYIHDNYSHGMYVHSDYMEIGYNYVANSGCCGAPVSYGYGIQLYLVDPGPTFTGAKVFRNYVTSSNRSGVVVGLHADGTDLYENIITGNDERAIIINYGATNTTIRNNVLYDNDAAGAGYFAVDLIDGSGATILNNAISDRYGMRKQTGMDGTIRIDSNIYDGVTRWEWNSSTYSALGDWSSSTGMDGSSLTGDPVYNAPGLNDFRPGEGSPMIDAGDDAGCARTIIGNHCDLGAFEATAGSEPAVAPSTPGNIRRTDKIP